MPIAVDLLGDWQAGLVILIAVLFSVWVVWTCLRVLADMVNRRR